MTDQGVRARRAFLRLRAFLRSRAALCLRAPLRSRAALCGALAGVLALTCGAWRAHSAGPPLRSRAQAADLDSNEPPFALIVTGEKVMVYRPSVQLLERLQKAEPAGTDQAASRDSVGRVRIDTLRLPKPAVSRTLTASGVTILPLKNRKDSFLIGARNGVLRFDLDSKAAGDPSVLLPGADVLALQQASDGTCYALLRTWLSDVSATQPYPAPILSFHPESSSPPETVAVAHPGAANLYLAAGDTTMWVPRLFGRTLDRVERAGNSWTVTAVRAEEGETRRPDNMWVLRLLAMPPSGTPYIFEQARGARPHLMALGQDGTTSTVFAWNRAFQAPGLSLAADGDLLLVNGFVTQSLLRIASGEETYLPVESPCSGAALSPDGAWMARAEVPAATPYRTRIELSHVGGEPVAIDWVDAPLSVVSFMPLGGSK
jgi:hypothetical protein